MQPRYFSLDKNSDPFQVLSRDGIYLYETLQEKISFNESYYDEEEIKDFQYYKLTLEKVSPDA